MRIFSKPKKRTIVDMTMKEENIPHSPKSLGVYKRVKIGVTISGNIYIMRLLTDILAVSFSSEVLSMSFSLVFKTYTFGVKGHNT